MCADSIPVRRLFLNINNIQVAGITMLGGRASNSIHNTLHRLYRLSRDWYSIILYTTSAVQRRELLLYTKSDEMVT